MPFSDIAVFDFAIRIIGRLAIVFILIGAYRLWHLPVLKRHSNQFFWLATIVCALSLLYTIVEFYVFGMPNAIFSIIFNVATLWVLAAHMNYRAYKITRTVGRAKIDRYTHEIDQKIAEIKETSTSV